MSWTLKTLHPAGSGFYTLVNYVPVYVLHERVEVGGPLYSVVYHIGMLIDVQDKEAGGIAYAALVVHVHRVVMDAHVVEAVCHHDPATRSHAGRLEVRGPF